MKTFRVPSRRPQRRGFTLIELLVVITIIGILASLILPGVQQVRANARRIECLNNMKNVGLAMMSYASSKNGQLPPLMGDLDINDTETPATPNPRPASWAVHLLPNLEQSGLYDRLVSNSAGREAFSTLGRVGIKVYTCPADLQGTSPGRLSFVVNAGYMLDDWDDNQATYPNLGSYDWPFTATGSDSDDWQTTLATGLFFRQNTANTTGLAPGGAPKMTLDRIRDGQSQTIMISENLDTRPFSAASGSTAAFGGWSSVNTGDLAFGLRIAQASAGVPADNTNTAGVGSATPAASTALQIGSGANFSLGVVGTDATANCKINARLNAVTAGTAPRPSSLHNNVVNAIMADGSGKSISQSIDDSVYARMISSNGNQKGQPILSDTEF